jgi:hypothetical protein
VDLRATSAQAVDSATAAAVQRTAAQAANPALASAHPPTCPQTEPAEAQRVTSARAAALGTVAAPPHTAALAAKVPLELAPRGVEAEAGAEELLRHLQMARVVG